DYYCMVHVGSGIDVF
nr:immunoglobulin light chain junction region [Macaca mulatta]